MKKLLCILLVCALLPALAGCGHVAAPQPDAAAPTPVQQLDQPPAAPAGDGFETGPEDGGLRVGGSLAALRQEILARKCLCAVAYLGSGGEGDSLDPAALLRAGGYEAAYPFLCDIPAQRLARADGQELYAIVPADERCALSVYAYDALAAEDAGGVRQALYESASGEPVFALGNVSDILPNLRVRMTTPDGEQIEFSPFLSLRDGRLACEGGGDFVYDFTLYAYEESAGSTPDLCGAWCYEEYGQDGSLRYHCLDLLPDAAARYYSHVGDEIRTADYTGIWTADAAQADALRLELTRAADGSPESPSALCGVYRARRAGDGTLTLSWLSGDALFPELLRRDAVFLLTAG